MNPRQVRKYYGTPTKFAKATGYTRVVLYQWEKQKYITERAQFVLSQLTGGALKVAPPYEANK